ncbi:extensin family protein [Salipiger sp. P9]|uniref:extensin-like domain-containing protein n=1 Tax=Salipiger pentaromativorans TaxID=2943193 RepID=UPI002157A5FB|nr:extensin family protein [Salipiger pentaromativorans]MCR8548802.1 extensin family protein [Salipiger pentaromativorans]
MRVMWGLVLAAVLATQSLAGAPETSPRPPLRLLEAIVPPGPEQAALDPEESPALVTQRRPVARPAALEALLHRNLAQELKAAGVPGFVPEEAALSIARSQAFAARSPQAIGLSLRPLLRPESMVERVMAKRRERARGAVCGDVDLQGEAIGYVPGKIAACGVSDAVRLRSVSGVALSQQAVMDCTTAKALKQWVNRAVKPAVGTQGGGVSGLRVAAHYACRTRNNQPGAKVSEHGKGRAIDIAAIRLRDGSEMSVLRDWGQGGKGRALRKMHSAACGTFGTVLGPGSDGYHEDHFHFDTARYRSGSYCR